MIDFEKTLKDFLSEKKTEVKDNEFISMFKKTLNTLKAQDLILTDSKYKSKSKGVFYRLDIDGNSYCDITLLKDGDENLKFKVYHLLHKDYEKRNKKLIVVFGKFMQTLCDSYKKSAEYNSTNNFFDSAYFTFKKDNETDDKALLTDFTKDFTKCFSCLRNMVNKQEKNKDEERDNG